MSIASEITRLQEAKTDILTAISEKGVEVPSGSRLSDCANLISSIQGGGSFTADNVVNIIPIDKMVVVDPNGYIGYDLTNFFQYRGNTFYYNYAILTEGADYSDRGLGHVTFYTPASNNIGGRVYNTVIIGGVEWMTENLDFKFSGCAIGQSTSTTEPRGNYYSNREDLYGENGNKYGLLYNWAAVKHLNDNKSELIPGWHVPSKDEWDNLITAVGGSNIAGLKLKSTTGWHSGGNGDGTYAFEAVPYGQYNNTFSDYGSTGNYWTSTRDPYNNQAIIKYMSGIGTFVGQAYRSFYYCLSVRLVKDVPSA